MKKLLIAVLSAVALLGGALAAPAQAASARGAVVLNVGDGWVCNDGYGHATTDTTKVVTKSGQVALTCRYAPGTWPLGTRHREDVDGDCFTLNFYGVRVALDSHFEVTQNGAAVMTCH